MLFRDQPRSIAILRLKSVRCLGVAVLISCVMEIAIAPLSIGNRLAAQETGRTKVAEGEYEIYEQAGDGAVGPFQEEIYNFHEDWILWRVEKGQYLVEGVRRFESPKNEPHSTRFAVQLSRDFTVIRVKEFAKLRWVPDSGPLSCEFRPAQLECSSGGSDPKREIKLRTQLDNPYGLLWPISPFSFSGITRQIERDRTRPTRVDLVSIEQPGMAHPVQATVLEGPIHYLGEEEIEAAGHKWTAHKFSLKVAMHPEYLIWTSPKGLLLALTVEHEHQDWPKEGMRLARFESGTKF
jgi:hypothetical protein